MSRVARNGDGDRVFLIEFCSEGKFRPIAAIKLPAGRWTGEDKTMKNEPNNPSFMRETRRRRSNSAGELPAEFDRHLVELDRKLSRNAASEPTPTGLAERVYRASVSLLPGRVQHDRLRFSRRVRTPVWGQLAMAASVAVAFVVAAWFHSSTILPGDSEQGLAQHSPTLPEERTADTGERRSPHEHEQHLSRRAELLSPEALRLLFDGGSDYLLDTRDLTHAEAVDDLHRLYERLSEL